MNIKNLKTKREIRKTLLFNGSVLKVVGEFN